MKTQRHLPVSIVDDDDDDDDDDYVTTWFRWLDVNTFFQETDVLQMLGYC